MTSIIDQLRDLLVEELEGRNMSAHQLAQEMGVGKAWIYAYLRGEAGSMSIERLEEIFDHLGYQIIVELADKR